MGLKDYLPRIKATLDEVHDIVKGHLRFKYRVRMNPRRSRLIFATLTEYDPSRARVKITREEGSVEILLYGGEFYELVEREGKWFKPEVRHVAEIAAVYFHWPISLGREEVVSREGPLNVIFRERSVFETVGYPEGLVLEYFFSTPGIVGYGSWDILELNVESRKANFWISPKVLFGFPKFLSLEESLEILITRGEKFYSMVKSLKTLK